MRLSILVCSVAERAGNTPVIDQLYAQANGLPVEVLVLTDNRVMSIGTKRNHLVHMATGEYVAFVDDDDTVADDYVQQLLTAAETGADVLTFTMEYRHNGSPGWMVEQSLAYPLHGKRTPGLVRITPHHTSAVRRAIAAQLPFADTSYGEDRDWARRLQAAAETEHVIDATLYIYNDTPATSIARQYANEYDPAAYNEWKAAQ